MNVMLKELMQPTQGLSLCWLGNDSWLLWDGKTLAATDLDLLLGMRLQPSPISPEELAEVLDVLFITHGHGDHFNVPTCKILAQGHCRFVIPESCHEIALDAELPQKRCTYVVPRSYYEVCGIQFATVRALHGHFGGSVFSGASLQDCGFKIMMAGKTIYEPGDTVLLQEHYEMTGIDVQFVSPTEHNTQVTNSKRMIELLKPEAVIAQHFGTYTEEPDNLFWTHGFVSELYEALDEEQKKIFIRPEQGKIIRL